ncbi:hypothetical protein [Lysobacter capsici]|uniref:hypothetical protein n=1 Tax=Lysobacter capsici TaxID=435897 RepID=UPI001C004DA2|nr:hypothetical protein [Lysobacter capsici]QWF19297.1 hypothetical protein KME82_11430 [Lysobacter capsici]
MSTVADIIRDALRHLRVQDPRQPLSAEDARDGMRMLNLMMRRWEADTLALGWNDVTDVTQTLPLPPEAELGVGYSLAVVLRPGFGVDLDPDVRDGAEKYLVALQRDALRVSSLRHGAMLPAGEADGYCDSLAGWPRR